MRSLSSGLLVALALLATGCQWNGRPDGGSAVHTGGVDQSNYDRTDDVEVVEPLDAAPAAPGAAPVDLTQPPPTMGTDDATSEVEEALTPGTEQ